MNNGIIKVKHVNQYKKNSNSSSYKQLLMIVFLENVLKRRPMNLYISGTFKNICTVAVHC